MRSSLDLLKDKFKNLILSPAWAGQVHFQSLEGHRLVIEVRNRFVRDWVTENYLPLLEGEVKKMVGSEGVVQLVVTPAAPSVVEEECVSAPVPIEKVERVEAPVFHGSLNPKYKFDNFVVGNSNQFAHAAAQSVADLPGKNYNPLFVYGGVGLGKTHLIQAIGQEFRKKNPPARIVYIPSEMFMNELIQSLRFQKMPEFRKKYRDTCDILLMDDVQFIAGKERTQEEFFHTFNYLHASGKQIVLTSDRVPKEITALEERIRSRLEWGLLADIQIPDLETRMAILKRKAGDDHISLSDEVTLFLATHIKSNVRELEGALIRLHAFCSLSHIPISIEVARETLKNVLGVVGRILSVEQVQKTVSDFYGVRLADLTGKRRVKSFALPRQIAMYLCRKHISDSSYPDLGVKFGGKDHSTVIHAVNKITRDLETNLGLKEQVTSLERQLV